MSFDLCKNGRYAVLNISGQVRIKIKICDLINKLSNSIIKEAIPMCVIISIL